MSNDYIAICKHKYVSLFQTQIRKKCTIGWSPMHHTLKSIALQEPPLHFLLNRRNHFVLESFLEDPWQSHENSRWAFFFFFLATSFIKKESVKSTGYSLGHHAQGKDEVYNICTCMVLFLFPELCVLSYIHSS